MSTTSTEDQLYHTEEIQDIIMSPPSWLLRWGIVLFFSVMVLIIGLSAFIRYPDIVSAPLKINSPNSPKPVVSKISGKLVKLLVRQNQHVISGQSLAYLESTANHDKVLKLLKNLKELQKQVLKDKPTTDIVFNQSINIEFGELQTAYQTFFQEYLSYKSAIDNGLYLKTKTYLKQDLKDIILQQQQLNSEKTLHQKELKLAEDEYEMHKKLKDAKVESQAEFRNEESKYLSQKSPLIQTEASLISANTNYSAKQKEILELDNQIIEEKDKFSQALNSLISQTEDWKSKYVLSASQNGKISYAGILQENQILTVNQEVFYINPGHEDFFGEMNIPQDNMGKIKEGQKVQIKLKSYPYEEYGMLTGRITYIADVPYKDSVFMSTVHFNSTRFTGLKQAKLKNGMTANAEIITEDASLLSRITRNITKMLK
ncbi:HlyD family secretion protein [Mucilaginibacter panaciglaebae]|uniref:HlyD family efflux transporter periplasmic adaptor subunit n=1 Tax=Mucilaginibacter panaciglaebae TaxID=502331 RepID=A0ABP7X2D7_9SPHI